MAENPKRLSFLLDQALVRLREAGRLTQPPTLTFIPVRPEEPGYSPGSSMSRSSGHRTDVKVPTFVEENPFADYPELAVDCGDQFVRLKE
ncbi:hypothetical protein QNM99_08585 [Pseudomonas sp. PCH446]